MLKNVWTFIHSLGGYRDQSMSALKRIRLEDGQLDFHGVVDAERGLRVLVRVCDATCLLGKA